MQSETHISKGHQVVVPAALRRKHGLRPGDILVWEEAGDEIRVIPRKRLHREDITGIVNFAWPIATSICVLPSATGCTTPVAETLATPGSALR